VALQFTDPRSTPCCNNSVASFTSKDGLSWHYSATVYSYDPSRIYQEGASENDVLLYCFSLSFLCCFSVF
jgi:hypothetical protein